MAEMLRIRRLVQTLGTNGGLGHAPTPLAPDTMPLRPVSLPHCCPARTAAILPQARTEALFAFSDLVKGSRHEKLAPWQHEINHRLSQLRARVEHPFRVVKRQFGFTKVRYRGLGENTAQLTTLLALSNLYLVRRQLLGIRG